MTAVLLTRANLNESCKNNERLRVILLEQDYIFHNDCQGLTGQKAVKCAGPQYTTRPINGSAEVSGVSCIHEDLCVVVYASFLSEDTTKASISKVFSPGGLVSF